MSDDSSGTVVDDRFDEMCDAVIAVLADVLDVPVSDIDRDRDFFEIGGSSVLVPQVAQRVGSRFGIEVTSALLYENPEIEELARAIIERQDQDVAGTPGDAVIPRLADRDRVPASFGQQQLWFLEQLVPDACVYNVVAGFRCTGRFVPDAFRRAVREVAGRHQVLRSTFEAEDGAVLQVLRDVEPPLAEVDAVDGRDWARVELRTPFDLATEPLLRTRVVRNGPEDHTIYLAMHHIITDDWSLDVLIREIAAFYRQFTGGAAAAVPELPVQYADVAAWQRATLTDEASAELLAYWREALDGAPLVLDLPADRPRPPVQSFAGAVVRRTLCSGGDVLAGAADLARRLGATPFMVLLSAFGGVLSRWADVADVLIGTPIADRDVPEKQSLIGFLLNTVAIRVRTGADPTFTELVGQVRSAALGAYAHQQLPFDRVVELLAPERELSRNPVAQVMFILHNAAPELLALDGLDVERVPTEAVTSKFDLTLSLIPSDDGVVAEWEYATDLFDRGTVESLAAAFDTLLGAALSAPDVALSALPLLPEADAREGWERGRGARLDVPPVGTHELIHRWVESTPDRVALRCGDRALSYAELWAHAGAIAETLRARGVGPDVPVGVLMGRTPALVPALLGVWLAGGAYLPLDTDHPADRTTYILDEAARAAGLRLVLTDPGTELPVPDQAAWAALPVALPEGTPGVSPDLPATTPAHLAYLIYTSGSTGRPKGVLIEHRNLVAFLTGLTDVLGAPGDEDVVATTSITFDISLLELFWPLATGRTLRLRPHLLDAAPALPGATDGATLYQATPTTVKLLPAEALAGRSRLLVGGEALPAAQVAGLVARVPSLISMYGPTEATIWVSAAALSGPVATGAAPLGDPLPNCGLHVLDAGLTPVPVGMPGELYLSGAQLARGYLGDAELAAQRFVTHPRTRERLYRTGDRARRRVDGALEYLGRTDHQIKLRGYRIELGEIESVLREHPAVKDCAARLSTTDAGEPVLEAFLVPAPGHEETGVDWHQVLRDRLPRQMVPGAFGLVERIPVNAAGKVDRGRLPALTARTADPDTVVAPRTDVERTVWELWTRLLERDGFGVTESFFELGGHSLMATTMLSRVQAEHGIEVPIREFFEAPTVSGLAGLMGRPGRTAGPELPPIVRVPRRARP
ncbi:amino acid adenylation domain-containing protein [Streptomyces sp. B6B3]|uniref:non-ribosomal peptide synthetase n=1 Tax=Streptomyces sp. B6B3 TaxID=3153570 RepID=UPI00325CB406